MRSLTPRQKLALERFEQLPDDAAVPFWICALVSNTSDRLWRDNPPIETFYITPGKRGANVGKLRKLLRGELTPCAA
jgi:hypothetical protein